MVNSPRPSDASVGTHGTRVSRSRIVLAHRIPIGHGGSSAVHLPSLLGGSQLPTPVSALGGPEARVAPIIGGATGFGAAGSLPACLGLAYPCASEVIRASRVKKFSGRAEDFPDFERQWTYHLRVLADATPGTISDTMALGTLRGYLDDASAIILEGRMHTDPSLSYYAFWQEFKDRFVQDARRAHRQAWKAVTLQISGSKVTVEDWHKFGAIYQDKRKLVEDWTDLEDHTNMLAQVPPEYQARVIHETHKRREHKRWVQVTVPRGLTAQEIVEEFSELVGRPLLPDVKMESRHFVISCKTDAEVRLLLDLNQSSIEGKVIGVQRSQYNMSGDEIWELVERLLKQDVELRAFRKAQGQPLDTPGPRRGKSGRCKLSNCSPRVRNPEGVGALCPRLELQQVPSRKKVTSPGCGSRPQGRAQAGGG